MNLLTKQLEVVVRERENVVERERENVLLRLQGFGGFKRVINSRVERRKANSRRIEETG